MRRRMRHGRRRWNQTWGQIDPFMAAVAEILRTLSSGVRWAIVRILSEGNKSTSSISSLLSSRHTFKVGNIRDGWVSRN